ncbi:hypothetical protein PG994_014939 [Apiospora phragmitis]|uniref:Pre-mRNA-splicing factor CWC2 n=1 Tax=Apiospora phragmitis TaxID=2905665 RepID=A0ABR1SV19_9PEZI
MAEDDNDQALVAQPTEVAAPAPKKMKKVVRKKRPARAQVDPDFITSEPPPQTGTIFNIWYNKWSGGDREDKYLSKTPAKGRCNIARDSGYTQADKHPGSYFCLFFARGICPKGQDCEYLHRLPGVHDLFNPNVDCFGRDKFSDYRDDMGGVGSFMRQNRTIYAGRIHVTDDIEEVVARHFAEWGPVERVRVLNTRGVGFITYVNEANAQFAKEAMAHQSLDHNEILNVRWATADPTPWPRPARPGTPRSRPPRPSDGRSPPSSSRSSRAAIRRRKSGGRSRARTAWKATRPPTTYTFARGAQAVNPIGRRGFELEDQQQQLMLEMGGQQQDGVYGGGMAALPAPPARQEEEDGIFSSSTLAALQSAKVPAAPKAKPKASAGPLVAYGSDDEDDDE